MKKMVSIKKSENCSLIVISGVSKSKVLNLRAESEKNQKQEIYFPAFAPILGMDQST